MICAVDLDGTLIKTNPNGFSPQPGMLDAMKVLYSKGFTFHLITSRYESDRVKTMEIVNELEKKLDFTFLKVTFTNGERKCKFANQLHCKFIIDDDSYSISDSIYYEVVPILYQYTGKQTPNTFSTWNEIQSVLIKLYDAFKKNQII